MLVNTKQYVITVRWNGVSIPILPDEEFNVRDFNVLDKEVVLVENRIVKKYKGIQRPGESPESNPETASKVTRAEQALIDRIEQCDEVLDTEKDKKKLDKTAKDKAKLEDALEELRKKQSEKGKGARQLGKEKKEAAAKGGKK